MDNTHDMRVIKRDGKLVDIAFDKILNRIKKIGLEVNIQINYSSLAMKVIDQLYDKISTTKIDELTAEQCAGMSTQHPDYGILAGRIVVSNHHKNTSSSFSDVISKLYLNNDTNGIHSPIVSHNLANTVSAHSVEFDEIINYDRDYLIDYFGFKTLERSYLFKINNVIVERPQHMWLRVAIGIHGDDLDLVKETYHLMSQKYFTHATPTLFNAGTLKPQLSSCFLLGMEEDSLDGIYNTLHDCANISKWAGGVGLHIHNVRANNSIIRGTNGKSTGIVPMLRVFNDTARFINQCFTPDTWVYSKQGPKQMKDIVANIDELITHDGTFKKVNGVVKNHINKEILEIRATNTLFPVKVTMEHQLYLIKNQKKITIYSSIKKKLESGLIKPDFYNASELTEDDIVGFPIPTYVKDNDINDLDYYKFYGMMLGDGHICRNRNEGGITLNNITKNDLIVFVKQYLNNKNIHFWESSHPGCTSIKWTCWESLQLTRDMLYDDNNDKYIIDSFLHLPINKTLKIVEGLLRTDGSNLKELMFCNTSLKLIMQMRYLFLRLGILTSGNVKNYIGSSHTTIHGRTITNKKISYSLRIPKHPNLSSIIHFNKPGIFFKYFEWNGILWGRIRSINKINYEGDVYDFNMIDNHNYLTDMGLVHNSGKRNGSFAIYLEPWHADIVEFLDLKKNQGDEELRSRDLFYALWVPDLFMKRIKENGKWSLFCPNECPNLSDVYGEKFEELYMKYESSPHLIRKTINARDLWFKILDSQMETGTPYLLYKDAANNKSNQKNLGTIKSSNLCVAPETKILTNSGYYEIKSLVNQKVNIWNGDDFSEVTILKTGENQELIEIETSDGCILHCTPYHKFYIQTKYNSSKISKSNPNIHITIVEAQNLKENDKLVKCDYPIIDGIEDFKYAYTHGFFCGDGTYNQNQCEKEKQCNNVDLQGHSYCKRHIDFMNDENICDFPKQTSDTNIKCYGMSYIKKPIVSLYGEKKQLLQYLDYRSVGNEDATGRLNVRLQLDINEKFDVPFNASIQNKLEWFSGYCDADGCITKNGTNEALHITCINKDFLMKTKLMLQTCGINPKVKLMRDKRKQMLPDSNKILKEYDCKAIYRLLISSYDLQKIVEIGFSPKRLKINNNMPNRDARKFITIKKVSNNGRIDDTYCFNEPKKHSGIFNGMITSQCAEILEYSDDKESSVCNLASIALPAFVNQNKKSFDYEHLHRVTKVVTSNLNKIIDINFYPTTKTRRSNLLHRPIGIGVQGLADVFIMMDVAFHSEIAKEINKLIFETMYHAALERSNELAKERHLDMIMIRTYISNNIDFSTLEPDEYVDVSNLPTELKNRTPIVKEITDLNLDHAGAYSSFEKSPASEGILQFDLWNVTPSERYDWSILKSSIIANGLRNSLLIAAMPTASTSQILGYNECFEPITSNIYSRRTLAGEFVVVNKYLMRELIDLGLWNDKIKNNIIANKGSIQQLIDLPEHIRNKYKIVWEIPMKHLIDMSADRGAFVCQSQSLNLWLEDPNYNTLTSMHFYSWKKGLKTGIYYLRRKAKHQAQQFTIEPEKNKESEKDEICEMCSA